MYLEKFFERFPPKQEGRTFRLVRNLIFITFLSVIIVFISTKSVWWGILAGFLTILGVSMRSMRNVIKEYENDYSKREKEGEKI